jgi:C2 domain
MTSNSLTQAWQGPVSRRRLAVKEKHTQKKQKKQKKENMSAATIPSHGVLPGGDDACAVEGQWAFVQANTRNPDHTTYCGSASLRVQPSAALENALTAVQLPSTQTRMLTGRCYVSAPLPRDTALIQPPPTTSLHAVALTCGGGGGQVAVARSASDKFSLGLLQPAATAGCVAQGVYVYANGKSAGVERWLQRQAGGGGAPQASAGAPGELVPGRYNVVLMKPKGKLIFPKEKENVAEVWVSVPFAEGEWAAHSLVYKEAASSALMESAPLAYAGTLLVHRTSGRHLLERHPHGKAVPTLCLFSVESAPDGRSRTIGGRWTNLVYFGQENASVLGHERWARQPAMLLAQNPKQLCVHVAEARNLTNSQMVGTSSPYFVVSLLRGAGAAGAAAPIELYSSGVVKSSLSPHFDHTHEVALKKLAKKVGATPATLAIGSAGLKLEILAHNRILKDDHLGELHLTWQQIDEAAGYGAHLDFPLRDSKHPDQVRGTVSLLLAFSGHGKPSKVAPVATVPGQFYPQ